MGFLFPCTLVVAGILFVPSHICAGIATEIMSVCDAVLLSRANCCGWFSSCADSRYFSTSVNTASNFTLFQIQDGINYFY